MPPTPPLDRGRAMALGVGSCKVLDRTKTAFAVNMALSVLPEGEGGRCDRESRGVKPSGSEFHRFLPFRLGPMVVFRLGVARWGWTWAELPS